MIKFILKCYVIVLHFLSFSLFFHFFFYFINTQNCPLRNVSFGYTMDIYIGYIQLWIYTLSYC